MNDTLLIFAPFIVMLLFSVHFVRSLTMINVVLVIRFCFLLLTSSVRSRVDVKSYLEVAKMNRKRLIQRCYIRGKTCTSKTLNIKYIFSRNGSIKILYDHIFTWFIVHIMLIILNIHIECLSTSNAWIQLISPFHNVLIINSRLCKRWAFVFSPFFT